MNSRTQCGGGVLTGARRFAVRLVAALAVPVAPLACAGDAEHLAAISKPDAVDLAVERGLAFLATQQDPVQGCFKGDKPNTYTGLGCMALMAAGHFPGRSRYGENLRRGVLYLCRATLQHNGYFGNESNARMYGHGMCTLALAEAYGMLQDEAENRQVKEALERALKVIYKAQTSDPRSPNYGGWRYEPAPGDADLSVTVWQIIALRAAQNCRLEVPDQVVKDALNYVRRTYHAGGKGFAYQPGAGPSVAMRSAGVVAMLALGANEAPKDQAMVKDAASFLLTLDPSGGGHFYYQSYYLATAANMAGDEHRKALLPRLEKVLLAQQQPGGEFRSPEGDPAVYATAFSLICLGVRYQYLPVYQE